MTTTDHLSLRTKRRIVKTTSTMTPTSRRITAAQTARHTVATADAWTEGRHAEALDMLATAEHAFAVGGPSAPLLPLLRAAMLPALGEYVPHTGTVRPVPADVLVAVDLGQGVPLVDVAGALAWGPGLGPNGEGRILRWARVPLPH